MGEVTNLNDYDATLLEKLLNAPTVIDSICQWNVLRYKQEPCHELAMKLLFEELQETEDAYRVEDKVAILDGLGDIFYVAIGVLWKTGLTAARIQQLMNAVDQGNRFTPSPAVALHWYQDDPQNHILCMVALGAFQRLEYLLGSDQLALDVIRAICISNDSKRIETVPSHVKANVNKGLNYIPPTEALKSILARYSDAH